MPSHDLLWKDIFLLPRSASLGSKIRNLPYKVLNRILFPNKSLFKMGIVASPLSTFCQTLEEPLDHQFIRCPISIAFWISVVERPRMHVTDLLLICSHGVFVYLTEISIFFYRYILTWM